MDEFLKNNFDKMHTMDLTKFQEFQKPFGYFPKNYKMKPCFFPVNELETAKRHLTLMKGNKWYDYTAKKEFLTIEEWLQDCRITLNDIRCGFNKFDGINSCITIQTLAHELKYISQHDELCKFMDKLTLNNHSLRENILIRTTEEIQTYTQYMR